MTTLSLVDDFIWKIDGRYYIAYYNESAHQYQGALRPDVAKASGCSAFFCRAVDGILSAGGYSYTRLDVARRRARELYPCSIVDPKFVVSGPVRGRISEHRTLDAAVQSVLRDQKACRKQGGYSDVGIAVEGDHESYGVTIVWSDDEEDYSCNLVDDAPQWAVDALDR